MPLKPDETELRMSVPRNLLNVLDAVCAQRGDSRTTVMTDLLQALADEEVRKAKIMYRLTKGTEIWGEG